MEWIMRWFYAVAITALLTAGCVPSRQTVSTAADSESGGDVSLADQQLDQTSSSGPDADLEQPEVDLSPSVPASPFEKCKQICDYRKACSFNYFSQCEPVCIGWLPPKRDSLSECIAGFAPLCDQSAFDDCYCKASKLAGEIGPGANCQP